MHLPDSCAPATLTAPRIAPLSSYASQSRGTVHHLEAPDDATLRRLLSLGFTRDTPILVDHRSLFGDLQVSVRGSRLALRADEAQMIWATKIAGVP